MCWTNLAWVFFASNVESKKMIDAVHGPCAYEIAKARKASYSSARVQQREVLGVTIGVSCQHVEDLPA